MHWLLLVRGSSVGRNGLMEVEINSISNQGFDWCGFERGIDDHFDSCSFMIPLPMLC